MNSRQLTRWFIAKLTAMLNRVSRTTGGIQPGFRVMSSNVAFGEKNTPMMRPNGLIVACASGAGRDADAISRFLHHKLSSEYAQCDFVPRNTRGYHTRF